MLEVKLCIFDSGRLGVVEGNEVIDVTEGASELLRYSWPYPDHDVMIENLPALSAVISSAVPARQRRKLSDVQLKSPVASPGKVIGAPVNYTLHRDESIRDSGINIGQDVKTIAEYGLFLKATSSIIGFGESIKLPDLDRRMDHEIELCAVIGKSGRNIDEASALDYVAGYTIGLDMTIRGSEDRSLRKSVDTFTVLGPWLVTADEFGSPDDVDFKLAVNGALRQSSNTHHLIYSVSKLIAYASRFYTLYPGDVIMTGTPEGVGPVVRGDILNCWMDKIGECSVSIE